jgi:hypothetical protein
VRNTIGFTNVFRMKDKWGSVIRIKGKAFYLGVYDTPELAAEAFEDAKAKNAKSPRWRPKIKPSSRNTSGHRGISWHKASGKWRVTTTVTCDDGKKRHLHLGTFSNLAKAKSVRKKHERTSVEASA